METDLIRGIAAYLGAAGIGTWSTTTPYTSSQVGIYDGPIPQDLLEGIGLETYPVQDPVGSESWIGLQVRFRSASNSTIRDRAEAVFTELHAAWQATFGGVKASQVLRRSAAGLGRHPDTGAWERSDSYHILINRPTANRL